MNSRTTLVACLAAITLGIAGCVSSPAQRPTTSSSSARAVAAPKDSKDLADISSVLGGTTRTLLVLDIDDTLLTSPVFYGSDAWYEWQRSLPAGDNRAVPCLFDVIAINTELGTQVETQP